MSSECIETTNTRDRDGYGRCAVRRYGRMIWSTHILAWIDAHGMLPPPETPCVLHRCDNPPCENSDHLFAGTVADNNRDMVLKGRHRNQKKDRCPTCDAEFSIRADGRGRWCQPCKAEGKRRLRARELVSV